MTTNEKPHPDMTDRKALDLLRDISVELLQSDREDKAYRHGETLFEIFQYLEKQGATKVAPTTTTPNHTENAENCASKGSGGKSPTQNEQFQPLEDEQPEIPETIKEVMKDRPGTIFVFTGCKTVNIYQR